MRFDWVPWSASALVIGVMSLFFAWVALTFGLPAILSVFERKGRRLGLVGVGVFTIGTVGTCGYAMLQVFFRALVDIGALRGTELDMVAKDTGLSMFLFTWIGGFYGGVLLIAIGLFVARSVPRWVPALMVAFVAVFPFASTLGRVGMAAQVLALAVAVTGIAMAAVSGDMRK